ncbi:MAG: type II toxin-antitoxin system HigB family toxin [Verrucomicrobia bacterium]|nr:type II toxin-antitoxin system HigB family toxin [Verrucomicrobiota bacterium]MBP5759961.1 type II toxin-antitoxin system HigB family toxin [Verrucomicrobiota bacterium]
MHIISVKALKLFLEVYPDAESALKAWILYVKKVQWTKPSDVLESFNNADTLKNNRVVFNIAHNKYRLIVKVEYKKNAVFIRFIGTHKEYDKIDAENI